MTRLERIPYMVLFKIKEANNTERWVGFADVGW